MGGSPTTSPSSPRGSTPNDSLRQAGHHLFNPETRVNVRGLQDPADEGRYQNSVDKIISFKVIKSYQFISLMLALHQTSPLLKKYVNKALP
jgi:hypothetical protein